jgi:hypothetical protein
MNDSQPSAPSSMGQSLLKALVLLLLTGFALMGLCGGVFSVIDLASGKAGHNDYVGPIPYFSLGIGGLGAWGCWWLFKRLRGAAK